MFVVHRNNNVSFYGRSTGGGLSVTIIINRYHGSTTTAPVVIVAHTHIHGLITRLIIRLNDRLFRVPLVHVCTVGRNGKKAIFLIFFLFQDLRVKRKFNFFFLFTVLTRR